MVTALGIIFICTGFFAKKNPFPFLLFRKTSTFYPLMSRRRPSHHGNQPRRESSAHGEFIMGRNCIEEVLRRAPHRFIEVLLAESRDDGAGQGGKRRSTLREDLLRADVPVREVSRRELDSLVNSDSHQGVIARVHPRTFLEFDDLLEMVSANQFVTILALDGVVDPQNVGAILRACECLGVDAVIWSKNRGAPLGPVVSKVSVGASEIVPLCPVSNLHQALERLKEVGAWMVGAMVSPDAHALDSFEYPEKTVLVMGAEGEGIHQLIEKSLDFRVYISMSGDIDSLNVSQATSVMLHELSKQRRQKQTLKVT